MNARLVDLEIRYTHQARLLEELSQELFEQRRLIEQLEKRLDASEKRVAPQGEDFPNEPPPHY